MTAPAEAPALPRWDVADVFPAVGSREYESGREALSADIARLTALYDRHDVRRDESATVDDDAVSAFEEVVESTNAVMEQVRRLSAYLSSFVTTDAGDDLAQGELSGLQAELAQLSRLRSRFDAWVASLGTEALVARSPVAADHAWPLQQSAVRAAHQMSQAEEELLADLTLTGSAAWQRLYGSFTSQLSVSVPFPDGSVEALPMSSVRGLARHTDAAVRQAAHAAELAAWEANAVPVIAALNAIKGQTSTVNRRRGWADDLEPALVANGVDRPTLDAMQAAVVASFPDFRRYLSAKARRLGHADGRLPFHDLFAPVIASTPRPWDEATGAVSSAFATYSPDLAGLVQKAVDGRWIDAEPRRGKRDGAFCMGIEDDRSLVLLNYDGSFNSVQTLAHELGHAYHNVTLAGRTPLQRQLPMALAETASIFCETIMVESGLAAADGDARLEVVEGSLQGACQVVVDIHSRFLFEQAVFGARARRTISAAEACDLMLDAQQQTYGDALSDVRHPWMWAAKPHYYGSTFYNWPYTFGLLFGLGLYARYRDDPDRFRGGYDDLLSSCGLGSAADLAGRFGIDVRDEAFWTSSLDVLRRRIDDFVSLA